MACRTSGPSSSILQARTGAGEKVGAEGMRNARPPDDICRSLHRQCGAAAAEVIIDNWRRTATGSCSFPRVDPTPLHLWADARAPQSSSEDSEK